MLSPEPGCCDLYGELSSCGDFYRCDTYFMYVLRALGNIETGENCTTSNSDKHSSSRRISQPNLNDGSTNFSDSIVLGLNNPLILRGLDNIWNVWLIIYG